MVKQKRLLNVAQVLAIAFDNGERKHVTAAATETKSEESAGLNYVTSPKDADVFHFFFSSRRRHTISTRDWSSDVCSSDLVVPRLEGGPLWPRIGIFAREVA